jgi:hypothetical protein
MPNAEYRERMNHEETKYRPAFRIPHFAFDRIFLTHVGNDFYNTFDLI